MSVNAAVGVVRAIPANEAEDTPLNLVETGLLFISVGALVAVVMGKLTSIIQGFAPHGFILVPSGPWGTVITVTVGGLVTLSVLGAIHAPTGSFRRAIPVLGTVLCLAGSFR